MEAEKRKHIFIEGALIAALLIIAGIVFFKYDSKKTAPEDTREDNSFISSVMFRCQKGKSIRADFSEKSVALALSDGRELTLNKIGGGSGARYSNFTQSILFTNKGNSASLNESGVETYTACVNRQATDTY